MARTIVGLARSLPTDVSPEILKRREAWLCRMCETLSMLEVEDWEVLAANHFDRGGRPPSADVRDPEEVAEAHARIRRDHVLRND